MKLITIAAAVGLLALCGCSPASHSPDAIRQNTANATAAATRDAKAVAQGIFEGLRAKGPLNINRADKDQLESLPGIGSRSADRIIAGRPYKDSAELWRRRILTRRQYDRIATKIKTR